jgi:phage terminase large subunit-like protein
MVPKELFADKPSLARGITDAYDTIQVRHVSGGISVLRFKSYEQGRAKWQGETLDFVWFDEEPDMELYSEGLTRITATKGMVFLTFTPLKGMSEVVQRFLSEASEDRGVTSMTIDDALHIPEEERARIIAGYPAHEREARVNGVPMLGSGRIFQASEEMVREEPFPVPEHWPRLWGIDFGIGHPFGARFAGLGSRRGLPACRACVSDEGCRPIDHAKAMRLLVPTFLWRGLGTDITAKRDPARRSRAITRTKGLPCCTSMRRGLMAGFRPRPAFRK